jgi:hypothetical protein
MRETRKAYKILVGKPLRKLRRKWEDNIRMNLRVVGYKDQR